MAATCSCGYPSVHLDVAPDVPAAELVSEDPDVRHGEDVTCTVEGLDPDGRALEVNVHVIGDA